MRSKTDRDPSPCRIDMTLAQLANFVRVAEFGSVSKAAAAIRIAQPALSRQIRALEAELGAPLLVRRAWGVSPTPAGEILVQHARRLIRDARDAREAVQALASEPSGRIDLGVPTSVATTLLPPLALALRTRWPRLRPRFVDGFSAALHARALAGDLDVAVLYAAPALGPLDVQPLLEEELVLVGPPGARVAEGSTAERLRGRSLILPARPNRLRLIVDAVRGDPGGEGVGAGGARNGDEAHAGPVFEVDSLPAIAGMVEGGIGFTVLPFSTVAAQVERGALAAWPLHDPPLRRGLVLATPAGRETSSAVRAVTGELVRLVTELAPALRWRPATCDARAA